jgi:hypothetical protein
LRQAPCISFPARAITVVVLTSGGGNPGPVAGLLANAALEP